MRHVKIDEYKNQFNREKRMGSTFEEHAEMTTWLDYSFHTAQDEFSDLKDAGN